MSLNPKFRIQGVMLDVLQRFGGPKTVQGLAAPGCREGSQALES